jgi:hypothetical protein
MRRVLASLLLLASTLVALPARAVMPPPRPTPLGWTRDSASFVLGNGELEEWADIDGRSGKKRVLKGKAAWEEWVAAHPLSHPPDEEAVPSLRSPDGKAEVRFSAPSAGKDPWWSAGRGPEAKGLTVSVVRGAETQCSRQFRAVGDISAFWAPDGRRLAWFQSAELCKPSMGDFACEYIDEASVDPVAGPRIHLVAFGEDVKVLEAATTALEKAGFAPTGSGPAQKERQRTVVYAAKGKEAQAKAVAAALPGKPAVEPLTWKADADVVVGLGR